MPMVADRVEAATEQQTHLHRVSRATALFLPSFAPVDNFIRAVAILNVYIL